MEQTANPVQLEPATLAEFDSYIREAEAAMASTQEESCAFLWSDLAPARARVVRQGEIVAELWSSAGPVNVSHGLIHDWIGAAFIANATLADTLARLQDYDQHKFVYQPEVIDSRLISREGDDFHIYLRLRKKKVVTVVLDTYHDVHYFGIDDTRWGCRSFTTRIAEVENAGTPAEKILPTDTGHGFLWRLYSYWRLQAKEPGGVHLECRAISLTRDIPSGLGWVIGPIIRKLPRESLIGTLNATRRAVAAHAAPSLAPPTRPVLPIDQN